MLRSPVFPALLALAASFTSPVQAQSSAYPARPVRVVVPLIVGGAADVVSRLLAQSLTKMNGQSFYVENKPGANTIIGTDICAKAPADGYTLCMVTSSSLSINPSVYEKLPYNARTDFSPVAPLVDPDMILLASPKLGVKSLGDLVDYAKQHSGKVAFGTFGIGSDTHITMEWLKRRAKVDLLHVPFNGFPPIQQAFTGGDIQLMYVSVGNPGVLSQIKSGAATPLAVFAASRSPQLPDVPTIDEVAPSLGFDPFQGRVWFGLVAPAHTPRPIIDKLNSQIREAMKEPALQEQLSTLAMRTRNQDAAQFGDAVTKDRALWHSLIQEIGVKIE